MLVESTNALLLGHPCALSTNDLHNHIQSHIDPDTMTTSTTAKLHLVTDYEKYKCALKVVDDACVCADELLKAAVQQMMQTSLTITNNSAKCAHSSRPTATSSTVTSTTPADRTTSHSSDCCPPLTTIERALLTEYSGCFRCCCFYAGHIAPACMDHFPDKTSYWPLTEADALVAKKHNNKKERTTPTAVVVPVEPIVSVAVVMPSAVLGNGSDSEYVDAPFFVPHFYLDCTAGGPSVSAELSTCALIDDGSDAVLIDPEFADCLGLARRKLP